MVGAAIFVWKARNMDFSKYQQQQGYNRMEKYFSEIPTINWLLWEVAFKYILQNIKKHFEWLSGFFNFSTI